jgi:hypothetical protein
MTYGLLLHVILCKVGALVVAGFSGSYDYAHKQRRLFQETFAQRLSL